MMSDDWELLGLAARAAGYKRMECREDTPYVSAGHLPMDDWTAWNPLADDSDALRMLAELELRITGLTEYIVKIETPNFETIPQQVWSEGKTAAIRRAIVRAAASIGKQIQNV